MDITIKVKSIERELGDCCADVHGVPDLPLLHGELWIKEGCNEAMISFCCPLTENQASDLERAISYLRRLSDETVKT